MQEMVPFHKCEELSITQFADYSNSYSFWPYFPVFLDGRMKQVQIVDLSPVKMKMCDKLFPRNSPVLLLSLFFQKSMARKEN
jgi:hypothetical protein